jgi:predicted TIM-barrel fold metal-dependent hydrolase
MDRLGGLEVLVVKEKRSHASAVHNLGLPVYGKARYSRREFLSATSFATAAALAGCATTPSAPAGIIDTHTHFYDPTRPQGVPWPPKNDAVLHRPVYPEEFKKLAQPRGVTGTVVVEASPWLEDNQWVLDLAARDKFLLGLVGNIKPGRSEFRAELQRFAANPLFRGIRVGVWERSLLAEDASVVRDLKLLAEQSLALDVLTGPDNLSAVAKLAAAVSDLHIIIDHCANVRVDGQAPPVAWVEGLRACSRHRNVFMKVSGLVEGTGRTDGSAPADTAHYRPVLDAIWESFGEDRVIYGSNWPVSARFASYATVFGIVNEYFGAKGRAASQKYFAANADVAYKVARP